MIQKQQMHNSQPAHPPGTAPRPADWRHGRPTERSGPPGWTSDLGETTKPGKKGIIFALYPEIFPPDHLPQDLELLNLSVSSNRGAGLVLSLPKSPQDLTVIFLQPVGTSKSWITQNVSPYNETTKITYEQWRKPVGNSFVFLQPFRESLHVPFAVAIFPFARALSNITAFAEAFAKQRLELRKSICIIVV